MDRVGARSGQVEIALKHLEERVRLSLPTPRAVVGSREPSTQQYVLGIGLLVRPHRWAHRGGRGTASRCPAAVQQWERTSDQPSMSRAVELGD